MLATSCTSILSQETRVYNVEHDVAGIVDNARQVTCFHSTQGTRVYNVKHDVAGIIR
jgi:hypothetical protein